MQAIVDENLSPRLSARLLRAGHTAYHLTETRFAGRKDPYVLANAFFADCVITNDRYCQDPDRIAAFDAMHDGLRIIWLEGGIGGRLPAGEQVEYVMRHLDELAALIEDPDGPALIEIIENGSRLRLTARSELDDWFRRPR